MNLKKIVIIFSQSPEKILAILVSIVAFSLLLLQLSHWLLPSTNPVLTQKIMHANNEKPPISVDSPLFTIPLFGDYLPNPSDATIRQSSLDIELAGIMYSVNPNQSQVLIRVSGGEESTYGIGDELPGGALIKQINEKGIVVLYHGALESLSLPKNELLFDKPAQPLFKE